MYENENHALRRTGDGNIRRINITLTDDEYALLVESYKDFISRYDPEDPNVPDTITGYSGALLVTVLHLSKDRLITINRKQE